MQRQREKRKPLSKLVDIAREALEHTPCKVWVMHGGAYEEVKLFSETIAETSKHYQIILWRN